MELDRPEAEASPINPYGRPILVYAKLNSYIHISKDKDDEIR